MAIQVDQSKEANPIAGILEEMFTLLQDLETRSVAVLEYLKEQGGASDEKLAPYLDRAAAASDVRWRAARARMDHLLAPKPKSATDVGKDDKSKDEAHRQAEAKESEGNRSKSQGRQTESDQESKPASREHDKKLASDQSDQAKSSAPNDDKSDKSKDPKITWGDKIKETNDPSQTQKNSSPDTQRAEQSNEQNPVTQAAENDKPRTQKAAK
jgi:hypothetical protein